MLPVLMACKNTPLATELSIRSLLHYNSNLEVILGDVGDEQETEAAVKGLVSHYERLPISFTHGCAVSYLYKRVKSDFFLVCDSDIELLGFGLVEEMLSQLMSDRGLFLTVPELEGSRVTSYPEEVIVKWSKSSQSLRQMVYQARPLMFFTLWRNDDLLKSAIGKFGFETTGQVNHGIGARCWDTGALLCSVMEVAGRRIGIYPNNKYVHYGALSRVQKMYKDLQPKLKERVYQIKSVSQATLC